MKQFPLQNVINRAFGQETTQNRKQIANYLIDKKYYTKDDLKQLQVSDWIALTNPTFTMTKVNQLRKYLIEHGQQVQQQIKQQVTQTQQISTLQKIKINIISFFKRLLQLSLQIQFIVRLIRYLCPQFLIQDSKIQQNLATSPITPITQPLFVPKNPQEEQIKSYCKQLTSEEKENICRLFNSKKIEMEQILECARSEVNTPKDKLILKQLRLLLRPLKPTPTSYFPTSLKKKMGVLPAYLYTAQKLAGVKYYTFLVIGGTDSGKTTLLDLILNKIMGIEQTDNWRYKLVNESNSSTGQDLKVYYINDPANKFNIKIIDTLGFGDNQGNNINVNKRNKFIEFFRIHNQIDYILFTNKASDQKLSQDSVYIYNEIQNLFCKEVASRFILIFTHYVRKTQPKCLEAFKQAQFRYQQYFCVNNGGLFDSERVNYQDWDLGMDSIDRLIKYILQQDRLPISRLQSLQVLAVHRKIQKSLQKSQQSLKNQTKVLNQTKQYLQNWRKSKQSICEKGQFVYIQKVRSAKTITKKDGCYQMCSTCNQTCCQVCIWPQDSPISRCTYFNNGGLCSVCPGKCPITTHIRTFELIQVKWEQKVIIKANLNQNYEAGVSNVQIYYLQIKKTISKLDQTLKSLGDYAEEIKVSLKNMNESGLQSIKEQQFYQQIIEQEKKRQQPEQEQRVKYLQNVINKLAKKTGSIDNLFPQIIALKKECELELSSKNMTTVQRK